MKIKKALQMKRLFTLLIAAAILSFAGCEYFENSDTLNISSFEVNLSGLPTLPSSLTYVGWFDGDDIPATYLFDKDADANGNIFYSNDQTPLKILDSAQIFYITIESKADIGSPNFRPSSRIILQGRFTKGAANLWISENADKYSIARAKYSLDTPTDNPAANDFSGLWFVDSLDAGTPAAGLDFPVLYGGWIYEGWIQVNGNYLSTGRFSNPAATDLFNGFSGASAGYPFPGEDFLNNAPSGFTFPLDLRGAKVLISLERRSGDLTGTAPNIILYSADIPANAVNKKSYDLNFTNNTLPHGYAVIKVDLLE
ncbi:hypothetical protein [Ignavibacterium album]|uniref:hypothetical protein n=1 Tax=Ignavibacterium album TaxID=591197 RepID=UPI0026F125CB|nr:hypothetical protein [Ignavibacterium album]